jgi:hypothetical protein
MFPRTFASVLMIVGAIWVIQGLGIVETGSFMDGERFWAFLGGAAFVAGLARFLVRRRKDRAQVDQAGS